LSTIRQEFETIATDAARVLTAELLLVAIGRGSRERVRDPADSGWCRG
jgi:hypothetical protein